MKIIQLTAENVKRLKAISITPGGAVVQITGRNAQGKSSVLDAITYALGGKDVTCSMPVRDGEKKARVVCQLDGLTVTRTFTPEGGGTLTVANAEGARFGSPQAMLDKLIGSLTFDPLAFSRQPAKQQAETLRSLVGLDFSAADAQRKALYEQRTQANATAKRLDAQAAGMSRHADAPAAEVSVTELARKLEVAQEGNAAIDRMQQRVSRCEEEIAGYEDQRQELLKRLKTLETSTSDARKRLAQFVAAASVASPTPLEPLRASIASCEGDNRKVRENARRAEVLAQAEQAKNHAAELSQQIEAIDAVKAQSLASAPFPVPGLAFDDTGVVFNGVPFSQASSAEQLRVSVAMGLALNPKLRVMLIRDGSLLDKEGMAMLEQIADQQNAQFWIERVSDGESVGVVIEDGEIQTAL